LFSWLRRYQNRDVAVVMVIAGEHREDVFLDEERWFTVLKLLGYARQRQADSADSLQMPLTIHALSLLNNSRCRRAAVDLGGPITIIIENPAGDVLISGSKADVAKGGCP
jgi:hypothetical protein